MLNQPGGERHGGQSHGDIGGKLGEELLGHHAPGGAAGSSHEGLLGGDLLEEVLGLLGGTHVGAHGNLDNLVKAHTAHSLAHLRRGDLVAELADKGGSHSGDHLVTTLDGLDELEDLALIGDSAEGAVDQTHAAGDALVIVDLGAAQLVRADGVHAAGLSTGALQLQDGAVGAGVGALAALDALGLVDEALALDQRDGVLGADLHAGVSQAALAHIGDPNLLGRAGVTGKVDDVDQGGLIVLLGNGALLDVSAGGSVLVNLTQRQADGQTETLADNGALQEDILTVAGYLAGNDFIGQMLDRLGVIAALKGQAGNFGKDLTPDIVDKGVDSPHKFFLLLNLQENFHTSQHHITIAYLILQHIFP